MEIPINSWLPATINITIPSGAFLPMIQEAKSKFEDNNHVIPEALFTNLLALLTNSIGMSEKGKPTTAEAGVPVLAFSPATTLNPEQEAKAPLTKNIFDIQNKKGTETQSASSGLAASETCATPSCTEKINYLNAIEDTTMFSPPETVQSSTQKDRDEVLLPPEYGNKSKTQPALPVRHLLSGDVGDLETPDTNPLAHQLHTVKGEIIITEPRPFSNGPFPLKARLLTGSFAFSTEAGIVTSSAFNGVRNAKPLKAELLEIDLLNTLQNENNKDTQSSSPPVSGNLLFSLPENKDTASPVRGSTLYKIIPVNPDNLVILEASNGTSEANNKLSVLNRIQQEIHNTEPKTAVKGVINQFVDADNDMVEVTAEKVQVEAKAKFSLPLPSPLPVTLPLPLPGEANPQQQVAGQNPSSLSIDSKINTNTQTAEQTQPAFRPTNGGQAGVGYLETPNNNSLTYQALAHVEYKSMSELSTPEITIEEITYPRTINPMPQEGLVSVLEKPIRQQSTSYTNPFPDKIIQGQVSASDGIPVLAEPNTIPLARQDPTPKGFDLSSAEGLMWKQDTALKTPAWEQSLITKRGIIVEPQILSNFAYIQENQPLTKGEKISYTSNAFLVSGEGSQISMLKKAELLEINLSNTIQEVNNLTLERSKGKGTQPSPPPFVPDESRTYSFVRDEQKPNLVSLRSIFDPFALPKDKDTSSDANNKLSMLNRLQQEIHNTEPKIAVKDGTNQYVSATNDMVEVTAEKVQVETKAKFSLPLPSPLPVPLPLTLPLPLPGEANPPQHNAGQNLLTLPVDYKIGTNTQTAGQTGTKPEIVQNETSSPPTQPADVEHHVETQDVASLHKEETKTVDLSSLKVKLTPDEQHKNLPTNLSTNEQNASIGASPLEGSVRQSVKDTPKMNNPHQIPEPDYTNLIEQIAQKARVCLRKGRSDIKLRLEPPELGHIKLKFSVTGNRLEASIEVENLNVMRAIEKDIPRLRESISSAGIDVGRLDVLCHEGNDGYHKPYFAQHTDPKIQNPTEEDTNIEAVEKVDEGLAVTGINNASDIGRIDYIV